MQLGTTEDRTWLCPSSCCSPSPFRVVRLAGEPSGETGGRWSRAAQTRWPTRCMPNIEYKMKNGTIARFEWLYEVDAAIHEDIDPASLIPSSRICPALSSR